ncbi:metal-dependent phosphohydrolase [Candidatus Magnetobacterium bavaricum]|uniref:Metal-dependent phosphohydrolase n=1 Tax=Candidatus Magnetobacterium bavaricum TaxID=29290 RepID=A0A0F3GTZ2_9BACT|nr:metal-dependent phosphohydrolase [Candidatus Magnetobacterium bavaricum]
MGQGGRPQDALLLSFTVEYKEDTKISSTIYLLACFTQYSVIIFLHDGIEWINRVCRMEPFAGVGDVVVCGVEHCYVVGNLKETGILLIECQQSINGVSGADAAPLPVLHVALKLSVEGKDVIGLPDLWRGRYVQLRVEGAQTRLLMPVEQLEERAILTAIAKSSVSEFQAQTPVVIISIYSARVCPFLAELFIGQRVLLFAVAFGISLVLRQWLIRLGVLGEDYLLRVKRQAALDYGLFVMSGVGVAMYNLYAYDFPTGSGLKVIVGALTLGFYTAIDLGLETERTINTEISKTERDINVSGDFVKLTTKIIMIATLSMFFMMIVIFLIISRNHNLFSSEGDILNQSFTRKVLIEIIFVILVFIVENINLIVSHSKNLSLFFESENKVLLAVANGDLTQRVAVSTNDEFGVIATYSNKMIEKLRQRTEELQKTRDVTILSLAGLAETRDNDTGIHILRTQRYVRALAMCLRHNPKFSDYLVDEVIEILYKSAPLHDIGKVGIRDAILLKPGKLTNEEFQEMKMHTVYGRDALLNAAKTLGSNSFLDIAAEIAYCHHEKWDGSGYPEGLVGERIHVPGRLMALADVYDALITKRVYKDAFSHEVAREIILKGRGSHFDPDVVDAFLVIEHEFVAIADEFKDEL